MKRILVLGMVLIFAFVSPLFSEENADLLENMGNGSINWTKGYVSAKGIGAPPANLYGKPAARPMALRAAKMDAMRNLLEVVKGVRIDSKTSIKDFAVESDVIRSSVEGMVRGAEEIKKEYMSDGTVEVTMKMDISGGLAQLVLPKEIKPIEKIQTVASVGKKAGGFTGLIVDARGLDARPAMAPKILDENLKEVYGAAYVSREYAVQQGVAGYAKDLEYAKKSRRIGSLPLVIKGIRAEGPGRCDLVISNSDAAKIQEAAGHLSFLKECRVMIILD